MKLIKIELKSGKACSEVFETTQNAIRKYGIANISKFIEFHTKDVVVKSNDKGSAVVLSGRSFEDLNISKRCGYMVSYNRPNPDKVKPGLTMLELSDEFVLETEITSIQRYDKSLHKEWNSITPFKPGEEWDWVIYHRNSTIIPRAEAETKWGKLAGIQGGIGYAYKN
jgi:hypothetical protein